MQDQQEIINIGNYSYTEKYCLGQGSFGKVYRGLNKLTNKTVAIKQVDGSLVSQKDVHKQIAILKQFKHKNIVEYEDAFQNGGYFYIVLEYCNGGDLRNLIGDSDESEDDEKNGNAMVQKLLDIFFQICEGFAYLRQFQIVHRDLKPSNILIHNGVYKIADFGLAKTEQLNKSLIQSDLKGVPIYMSPQILSRNYYTYKCDVWSLGVIVFELYFDSLPWKGNDIDGLFFEIMRHPTPYLQLKKKLPGMLRNILDGTLKYLQKERLSWGELLTIQKGRKKIFSMENRIDLNKTSAAKEGIARESDRLTVSALPDNFQKREEISPSKISRTLKKGQAQILNHVRAQCQSLSEQLNKIIAKECLQTFIETLQKYLREGIQFRECLNDCAFMLTRRASQNLHMYMIELQSLEDARELLILLELIGNIVEVGEQSLNATIVDFMGKSKRNQKIQVYAAQVISQMNTLMINRKLQP